MSRPLTSRNRQAVRLAKELMILLVEDHNDTTEGEKHPVTLSRDEIDIFFRREGGKVQVMISTGCVPMTQGVCS